MGIINDIEKIYILAAGNFIAFEQKTVNITQKLGKKVLPIFGGGGYNCHMYNFLLHVTNSTCQGG
jgi:hypothetical protein